MSATGTFARIMGAENLRRGSADDVQHAEGAAVDAKDTVIDHDVISRHVDFEFNDGRTAFL